MTDAPKLLTEAEASLILLEEPKVALGILRERGLIAPEPVDPLLIEAREIVIATTPQPQRNFNIRKAEIRRGWKDDGFCVQIALAALKRGMEMRAPLTREMVFDALYQAFQDSDARDMDELDFGPSCVTDDANNLTNALHAALTKEQS